MNRVGMATAVLSRRLLGRANMQTGVRAASSVVRGSNTAAGTSSWLVGARALSSGPQYKDGPHRSNAEKLVNDVPVIDVEGHVAVCDGGSGALGHPIEYIQLDTISNEPQVCKYCGLRYKMAHH